MQAGQNGRPARQHGPPIYSSAEGSGLRRRYGRSADRLGRRRRLDRAQRCGCGCAGRQKTAFGQVKPVGIPNGSGVAVLAAIGGAGLLPLRRFGIALAVAGRRLRLLFGMRGLTPAHFPAAAVEAVQGAEFSRRVHGREQTAPRQQRGCGDYRRDTRKASCWDAQRHFRIFTITKASPATTARAAARRSCSPPPTRHSPLFIDSPFGSVVAWKLPVFPVKRLACPAPSLSIRSRRLR